MATTVGTSRYEIPRPTLQSTSRRTCLELSTICCFFWLRERRKNSIHRLQSNNKANIVHARFKHAVRSPTTFISFRRFDKHIKHSSTINSSKIYQKIKAAAKKEFIRGKVNKFTNNEGDYHCCVVAAVNLCEKVWWWEVSLSRAMEESRFGVVPFSRVPQIFAFDLHFFVGQ